MASVSRLDRIGAGRTGRPRSNSRSDLVSILLGMWVVRGLVADGNAHVNTPQLEAAPAGKPGVDATDLPARR
jgi:hypothetical protein